MLAQALKNIEFFSDLTEKELKGISGLVEILELKEGEILFREGDTSRDLYFILEGRFNIMIKMLSDESIDHSSIMSTVKSGEILGELSFMDAAPRSATVKVRNDAKVLRLPYDALSGYFESNPATAYKLIRRIAIMLANRVRNVNIMWRNSIVF